MVRKNNPCFELCCACTLTRRRPLPVRRAARVAEADKIVYTQLSNGRFAAKPISFWCNIPLVAAVGVSIIIAARVGVATISVILSVASIARGLFTRLLVKQVCCHSAPPPPCRAIGSLLSVAEAGPCITRCPWLARAHTHTRTHARACMCCGWLFGRLARAPRCQLRVHNLAMHVYGGDKERDHDDDVLDNGSMLTALASGHGDASHDIPDTVVKPWG